MKNVQILSFMLLFFCLTGFFSGHLSAAQKENTGNASAISKILEKEFVGSFPSKSVEQGEIKEFDLVASKSQWGIVPPYQTEVWAYNKKVPGPVFRIKLGDTIKVRFTNKLSESTTIHWHGIRVPNAMDGVPGVTQQPIKSGESFVYQFTPKDAGTFWFHPHVNTAEQVERGLHGVLIVEDPDEPQYSQDLVMVLDDWRLDRNWKINDRFVTRHDLAHDGRWGNIRTVNGQLQPVFDVKTGERIRIRMINVANGRVFSPQFPDLSPHVIAVDGMLTGGPFPLKRFFLAPGNRMDLDLVIPKTSVESTLEIVDSFSRKTVPIAFLRVESGETVETPHFNLPQAAHFPEWSEAINAPVSHEYDLDAKRGGPYGISWTINDSAWPEGKVHELEFGRFNRLRFTNKSSRLHPMHLHGQFFKLIARDGIEVTENFWRDTILVGPKESVDIGLVPLDKGLWASHCHILEHAEAGMMSTVRVK